MVHRVPPTMISGGHWPARGMLAIIVAINLALVYANVLFSTWNNRFYNALQMVSRCAGYRSRLRPGAEIR